MRFPDNFQIEKNLHLTNKYKYIAGVDEVGRGPLAGPLVVAAVILNLEELLKMEEVFSRKGGSIRKEVSSRKGGFIRNGVSSRKEGFIRNNVSSRNNDVGYVENETYKIITDSKKISPTKRHRTNEFILNKCISYSIVEIDNAEIDREGMGSSILRAFNSAVHELQTEPDFVITDSVKITELDGTKQLNLISGDLKSITVGAASIIAKVHRDNIMTKYDSEFPLYGFGKHKGYGTKYHMEALMKHGPCEIHRKSFRPISETI